MLVKENENIQVHMLQIQIADTNHITNTYVLKDKKTNKLTLIDPAYDGENILKELEKIQGELEAVIITHSHADHIAGLAKIVNDTNIKVYIYESDLEGLYDPKLNEEETVKTKVQYVNKENITEVTDNDKIQVGNTNLEVMHTPGHTKGSMILFNKEENIMFAGDTIFKRSYGRTDLITGSSNDMKESLDKIFNTFEDIEVFPGHDEMFNLQESKRRIKLLFAFKDGK